MTIKNMVPCKVCGKSFEYIPGPSGNARQFCEGCKNTVNEKEMVRLEEEMIVEKNRYLLGTPKRKNEYDPVDILINKNIPEFQSNADRFICSMEMGYFVRKTGITGLENGIMKFFDVVGLVYVIIFMKQQPLQVIEHMAKDERFKKYMSELSNIIV